MGMWKVTVMESERGWGRRVDQECFWSEEKHAEARKFVDEVNSQLGKEDPVPEVYYYAVGPTFVEEVVPTK